MSDIDERMAAYIKHDHNVAWKALWDRCEQAEAEVKRLTIQVEELDDLKMSWAHMKQEFDVRNAENDALRSQVEGKPIASAPKDGSRILVQLKNPLPAPGRDDLERWHGVPFVACHPGICEDGFDIGWNFAAPVGHGGFPDDWIECWWPLPTFSSDNSK